jgi:iron only hydrogenase large subunit
VILGNDAVLAAAPATSVQLAHACLAYGFELAVPASWGDELIATETLKQLSTRGTEPAVHCACPYVASRLFATGADLAPFLVSVVSPPIATARYIRAAYGTQAVRITYVGACPVQRDASGVEIDVALLPSEFFRKLATRGISLSEQPRVFDSVVPPDRRRWCSVPGGLPSPDILWKQSGMRSVIELDTDDITAELAQHLIARENVLVDLAPRLRCACSGVTASTSPRSARSSVTVLEPPRAFAPIVDDAMPIELARESCVAHVPAARVAEPSTTDVETLAASAVGELAVERPASPTTERASFDLRGLSAIAAFASGLRGGSGERVVRERPIERATEQPIEQAVEQATEQPVADIAAAPSPADAVPAVAEASVGDVAPGDVADERDDRERSAVRRRTPATAMPRVSSGSFPRIASAEFRALPRAYVGKRRAVHLARPEPQPLAHDAHEAAAPREVEVALEHVRETLRMAVPEPSTAAMLDTDARAVAGVSVPRSDDASLTSALDVATESAHHANGAAPELHGVASGAANGLATEDPPGLPPPASPEAAPLAQPAGSAGSASRRTASVTMRQTPGRDHPTSFEAFRRPAPSREEQERADRGAALRTAGTVIALIALLGVVLVLYTLVMH